MKRLVLVRHGESVWNVERRIQGQAGSGLTERGSSQAQATARWLAEAHPDAVIVTSDLERCTQTVAPLEDLLGRSARRHEGLRERDFGRWSGRLLTEVEREDPDRWERWRHGGDVVGELGGEGTTVFRRRVLGALRDLLGGVADDATLVCVTHGGTVWHGTQGLLELPEGVLGGVANAGVTELAFDPHLGHRLNAWNQTAHLPLALRGDPVRASIDGRRGRDQDAPPTGT